MPQKNNLNRDVKVTVYTAPGCVYCNMAKKFFMDHDILFKEVDVSEDVSARENIEEETHQSGVPVIEVGDHVFVGFDRKALEEVLEIKKGRG